MKHQTARALTLALCLAVWAFIFSNSLQGSARSSQQSDAVLALVNQVLSEFGTATSGYLVRKAAHFLEFAALGGSLTLALRFWTPKLAPDRRFALALTIGVCSAALDETLQLFSFGRAAQLSDVILDSSGVIVGAALLSVILLFRRRTAL